MYDNHRIKHRNKVEKRLADRSDEENRTKFENGVLYQFLPSLLINLVSSSAGTDFKKNLMISFWIYFRTYYSKDCKMWHSGIRTNVNMKKSSGARKTELGTHYRSKLEFNRSFMIISSQKVN